MNVNPDSIDADLMSEKAVIDRQSVRYVVMTSAQKNPNVIIPKLEKVWKSSSDKSGLVANDDVVASKLGIH